MNILRDIASKSGVSAGSVETIIHEHLLFKKVCLQYLEKDGEFGDSSMYILFVERMKSRSTLNHP